VSEWSTVLDSIAAQVDLQRRALSRGTAAPPDLEIHPPDVPLDDPAERLRTLALIDESERLANLAVARLTTAPPRHRHQSAGGPRR
jgi:hypothetical protein